MKKNYILLVLFIAIFSFRSYSNPFSESHTSFTKTDSSIIVPVFSSYGPYCENSLAPSLPLTSLNGISGTWSPSSIDTNLLGTSTYTFTPNSGQDAVTASITITINATPPAPISNGSIMECELSPIQTLNASNLVVVMPGHMITWYSAAITGSLVLNPILNTVGTLTYYAESNNGNCASYTRTPVTLTILPAAYPGILSGAQNICVGTNTVFLSTVGGGTWSSSNPAVASVNTTTGNITGIAAGSTNITYTVNDGICSNASTTRFVTVTAQSSPGVLSGNQTICREDNQTIFTSTVAGGIWTSSNTSIATINPVTGLITPVNPGVATMTYTVLGTGGCANATNSRSLTIAEPYLQLTSGSSDQVLVTNTALQPMVFASFYVTNVTVENLPIGVTWNYSDGVLTISGTPTTPGVYEYGIIYSGDCDSAVMQTGVITVSQYAAIAGNYSICLSGTTTTQLIGSGIPNATTPWVSSNPSVATVNNTGLVTAVSFGATTITYSNSLNENASATIYVSNFPTISGEADICIGGMRQLTGSNFANPVMPWTSSNTAIATVDETGLVTGVSAGTVNIIYRNFGGCTVSATITVKPLLMPVINCGSATANQITIDWAPVSGATTYARYYAINGAAVLFAGNGSATTYSLGGLSAGDTVNFFVTPAGAFGNCFAMASGSCSTNVNCTGTNTPSAPALTLLQPNCAQPTGSIAIIPEAGNTYSLDGSAYSTAVNYSGISAGSEHIVMAKNTTGCVSNRTTATIIDQPSNAATLSLTSAAASKHQALCQNTSILPVVFTIGNGATGASIASGSVPDGITGNFNAVAGTFTVSGTVLEAGTFNYVVSTIGGCGMATLSGSITVNPTISNLFCDASQTTTPNAIYFDWEAVPGVTNYEYFYSINDGPYTIGNTSISHYEVPGVLPGQTVVFSVAVDGIPCSGAAMTTCAALSNEDFEGDKLQYFPNPVDSILNINNINTVSNVVMSNAIGQKVYNKAVTSTHVQIDMSAFTKGMYIVKVTTETGTQTFKIIKN